MSFFIPPEAVGMKNFLLIKENYKKIDEILRSSPAGESLRMTFANTQNSYKDFVIMIESSKINSLLLFVIC